VIPVAWLVRFSVVPVATVTLPKLTSMPMLATSFVVSSASVAPALLVNVLVTVSASAVPNRKRDPLLLNPPFTVTLFPVPLAVSKLVELFVRVPFTVSVLPPLTVALLPDFNVRLPVMVAVAPLRLNCPPSVKPPSNLRVLLFPNIMSPVLLMVVAPVTSRLSALPPSFSSIELPDVPPSTREAMVALMSKLTESVPPESMVAL